MNPQQNPRHAFTIVELLVVIAVIAVLVAIQIPALAASKAGVQRIYCSNNLKQVGIAFRTWAGKNAGRMPMAVQASQGGAAEAIGVRGNNFSFSSNMNPPKGVFGMFVVMSNELTTPKILYCPSEYRATVSQGSIFGNSVSTNLGCYSDNQISYFVGVDASESSPEMFLSGDANIGDGATPPSSSNTYSDSSSSRKFVSLGTNTNWLTQSPNWADSQHAKRGNVAFVDGSVQNLDSSRFRHSLNKTGDSVRSAGFFSLANGSLGLGINRLQFP